jgi:hydrogenase expression/formation protein HypC
MCLGIPGCIVRITDAERKLAMVDVSGVQREVNVACIIEDGMPVEDCIGDWVLVHVGFAMSRIDEAEAEATLRVLNELGEVQQELAAMAGAAGSGSPHDK